MKRIPVHQIDAAGLADGQYVLDVVGGKITGLVAGTGGGGGSATLDGLTDVDTTGEADGQGLTFDEASSLWVPSDVAQMVERTEGATVAASVIRTSTSSGAYPSLSWNVSINAPVDLKSFVTDIFAASTYTLSVDGAALATVAATAGQAGVTFSPTRQFDLASGTHTFKLAPTSSVRWYFANSANPGVGGSGASYVSGWGQFQEAGGAASSSGTLNFAPYSFIPLKSGIVNLDNGAAVSPGTKIGAVIFEKGVGLRGWWDGATIQAF